MKEDGYRGLKLTLKYCPVIAAFIMMVDVAFLISGQNFNIFVESTVGFSWVGVVLLLQESYVLNFCWLYRSYVIYDGLVYNCILFQRELGFGELILPARVIVLLIGIVLFSILLFRSNCIICHDK